MASESQQQQQQQFMHSLNIWIPVPLIRFLYTFSSIYIYIQKFLLETSRETTATLLQLCYLNAHTESVLFGNYGSTSLHLVSINKFPLPRQNIHTYISTAKQFEIRSIFFFNYLYITFFLFIFDLLHQKQYLPQKKNATNFLISFR